MVTFVNLTSEVLIDRSRVRDPYVRLLLAALGRELVRGSPWIALDKTVASNYEPLLPLVCEQPPQCAA